MSIKHPRDINVLITRILPLMLILILSVSQGFSSDERLANSPLLIAEAYAQLSEADTLKALETFALVHPSDTNFTLVLLIRIDILRLIDDYKEALVLANKGLEDGSDDESKFYNRKGRVLFDLERYAEALLVYEEGIRKYPYNHLLYYFKALAHRELKQFDEYTAGIHKSISIYPFGANGHRELGLLAVKEGRISQALMSFIMAILVDPNSSTATRLLGYMNILVTGKVETERIGYEFPKGQDDYSEIDLIIKNYAALQKGYKVKSKADLPLIRQIQVLLERLEYDASDKGYWMQYYVKFYKKLWDDNMFAPFSYYLLKASDVKSHQKLVIKRSKDVGAFAAWASDGLIKYFNKVPIVIDGEAITLMRHYSSGGAGYLASIGEIKNRYRVGCWTYFHSTGKLRGKGCYDSQGKSKGDFIWYGKTGKLHEQYTIKSGKISGTYVVQFKIGGLFKEVQYRNGEKHGFSKEYYKLGGLYIDETYKYGEKEGPVRYYFPNGKLNYSFTRKKGGDLHGTLKQYYANGQLKEIQKFNDGYIDSVSVSYYPNGQVESTHIYKEGYPEGKFEKYYMDGKLMEKGVYMKGALIGESITYFDNGVISERSMYDEDGKENGVFQEYDKDGLIYREFTYKKGVITLYKIYNKKGKVIQEGVRNGGIVEYKGTYPDGTRSEVGSFNPKKGREGPWTLYDKFGNKSLQVSYVKSDIIGTRTAYFANGKVRRVSEYSDGQMNGSYIQYWKNESISEQGYVREGSYEGPYYKYHSNGALRELGYYFLSDVHGWMERYGENGKLRRKYYYDHGDLIMQVQIDSNGKAYDTLNFQGLNGLGKLTYPNGAPSYQAEYINGIKYGLQKYFYGNGQLRTEGNYINGNRVGEWKSHYANGQLSLVENYVYGYRHGETKRYHKNGQLHETFTHNYGELTGLNKFYSETGNLTSEYNYELDERHGKTVFFDPNGVIDHIRYYHYGKMIGYSYTGKDGKEVPMIVFKNETGTAISYFQNGNVAREYKKEKGMFQGPYKEYYASGQLSEITHYKDDDFSGERIYYWENGNVKKKINYEDNYRNGNGFEYYENGNIKLEKFFINGTSFGTWKYYNGAGKLIREDHYYNNLILDSKKY